MCMYSIFDISQIFICMKKTIPLKTKPLRIRITEEQFIRLSSQIIEEETTKSTVIRQLLHSYLDKNCRSVD